jgi:hypothetical protein
MNTGRIFAIEFFICTGITSWGAIKQGDAPWPPVVVRSAVAMAILSMASIIDDRLAVMLATGFLLALLVGVASGNSIAQQFAATPDGIGYDVLKLGGSGGSNGQGSQGQGGSGQNSGG